MNPTVEVTGRGVVSALGCTVGAFSAAILAGQSGVVELGEVAADLRFKSGAAVRDFNVADHFDQRAASLLDRFTQFAVVAARDAVKEAGLTPGDVAPGRLGVIIGTANAGIDIIEAGFKRMLLENRRPVPLTVPMTMGSAPASRIAQEAGAKGPVFGVTSACAASAHAIMLGLTMIRAGLADVMIVGGADSTLGWANLTTWDGLRVVSPTHCRPFSLERDGLVLGEGAGVLILEAAGRAAARGHRPLGILAGAAMTSDAADLLNPDSEGMTAAMTGAMADASLGSSSVDYVNAHGTGTRANDRAESAAIQSVFGAKSRLSVSSTKAMTGHALGASGALEALATLCAIQEGVVPPTINFLTPDPECDLDVTPNEPRYRPIGVALSNSFAFGGLNVSLAFAHPDA
jgi:nodulation protein E